MRRRVVVRWGVIVLSVRGRGPAWVVRVEMRGTALFDRGGPVAATGLWWIGLLSAGQRPAGARE
ncbi:hypothetical protein GCM10027054_17440 [Isoptericola nanjingensis]